MEAGQSFCPDLLKSGTLGAELTEKTSWAVMAAVGEVEDGCAGGRGCGERSEREICESARGRVERGGGWRDACMSGKRRLREMERLATAGTVAAGSKAQ